MTNSGISVRKGTDGDIGDIVNFNMAMATERESKVLSSTRLRAGVAAVTGSTDRGFYVVAEGRGEAIGVLHVIPEWNPWRNRFFWWIENVYVVPDGVARASIGPCTPSSTTPLRRLRRCAAYVYSPRTTTLRRAARTKASAWRARLATCSRPTSCSGAGGRGVGC